LQSNAQINVHAWSTDTVCTAQVEQEVKSTDVGSTENSPMKGPFLSTVDTSFISYNLQPRSTNKDAPKLFFQVMGEETFIP
jgi:hypothetical protein